MKLAIVGSRSFTDYYKFCDLLREVILQLGIMPSMIISGGARGTDAMAKQWAFVNVEAYVEAPANWNRGKAAGFLRNKTIVELCDQLVAFRINNSPGTTHSINLARDAGKLLHIFDLTEEAPK